MHFFRPLIFAALGLLGSGAAFAASDWIAYSAEQFGKAQAADKTILVDVAASWCPTCKAQRPILDELRNDKLDDTVFMRVDFDKDQDFLRAHKIPRQSTIVIFNGKTELARSIAETDRERLREFVFNAVGH